MTTLTRYAGLTASQSSTVDRSHPGIRNATEKLKKVAHDRF
ncbi:hypothetical protein SAMN05443247_06897 [Bradyrhizobium erythrophlei]|nr:hypothetical protein SAMN05443247_06897 [Bradyrhizobium erythrophlei]